MSYSLKYVTVICTIVFLFFFTNNLIVFLKILLYKINRYFIF